MKPQTAIGGSLIAVALLMFLSGIGEQLEHLQNFDGLTLIQAAGKVLKHGAEIGLSAVGGTLIQLRRTSPSRSTDHINPSRFSSAD